jgi:CRISPR/Cas system-associated endonuclease Cas3-HD
MIDMDNIIEFKTKKEKDWLKNLLSNYEVTISFKKKDGTERKMICTLSESVIPAEKLPKNTGKSKNDEVCPVFDVENQGWRSFRWDSLTRIEFKL